MVSTKRLPAALLRAEGELAPDDRMAQRTLARIVGRLDAFATNERPEPVAMLVQLLAHADQRFVAALDTAQQQTLHLAANRGHAADERRARLILPSR